MGEKESFFKKWWPWLLSPVFLLFFLGIDNVFNSDEPTTTVTTPEVVQESTVEDTAIQTVEQESKPLTLEDKIRAAADPDFGDVTSFEINDDAGKNDGGKIVLIRIQQDLLTRRTADYNTTKALEKVFQIEEVNEITYFWEATLVDVNGNESVDVVDKIQMSKETASTINWENFVSSNLEQVADQYNAHPALE
jgi:hypothetical protein